MLFARRAGALLLGAVIASVAGGFSWRSGNRRVSLGCSSRPGEYRRVQQLAWERCDHCIALPWPGTRGVKSKGKTEQLSAWSQWVRAAERPESDDRRRHVPARWLACELRCRILRRPLAKTCRQPRLLRPALGIPAPRLGDGDSRGMHGQRRREAGRRRATPAASVASCR